MFRYFVVGATSYGVYRYATYQYRFTLQKPNSKQKIVFSAENDIPTQEIYVDSNVKVEHRPSFTVPFQCIEYLTKGYFPLLEGKK